MDEPQQRTMADRLDALRDFAARVQPGETEDTSRVDLATTEVLAEFEAAGIEVLLLKGPALGVLLYGVGEHRSYSDTDLLVAPERVDAAGSALAAIGYTNADSSTGVHDVGRVVHAHTWVRTKRGVHSMVDLHHWLPGSREPPEVVWNRLVQRRTWIELAGRRVAVLDRSGQAMHLALHAAQHGAEYTRQRDELELALRRWPAEVWSSAADLAREVGATETFAAGLRLVPRGPAEAARLGLASTAELDWVIRHRATRPRGTFHVQALTRAESGGDRLRILRRALFPSRAWITYQHPWARTGVSRFLAAYLLHLARTPVWAVRAAGFTLRARKARRRRG